MNVNTLAAYATILSAGILIGGGVIGGLWRVWTWRREHATNVKVQISMGFMMFGPNAVDAVIVTVFNRGSHTMRVTGAGVEVNDGSKRAGHVQVKPGADSPGIVAPRDSGMTWIETAELVHEGFDVYRTARAFARDAESDRPIWSKRRTLMR